MPATVPDGWTVIPVTAGSMVIPVVDGLVCVGLPTLAEEAPDPVPVWTGGTYV